MDVLLTKNTILNKERVFGTGEWLTEPDLIVCELNGLKCWIERHPESGHLCGYVIVPSTSELYHRLPDDSEGAYQQFDVHGQVTAYDAAEAEGMERLGQYLGVPLDVVASRIVGFDAGHNMFDQKPEIIQSLWASDALKQRHRQNPYRNVDYMKKEVKKLAEQIAAL